jgi:hypothetical protein
MYAFMLGIDFPPETKILIRSASFSFASPKLQHKKQSKQCVYVLKKVNADGRKQKCIAHGKINSVGVREEKAGEIFLSSFFSMSETFHLEFKEVFFMIQMNINRRVAI